MTPIPPDPDRATVDLMAELSAQSNQLHRRLMRWVRRYVLAMPCYTVLAGAAIVRRRLFGRDE
jgi:hypothetical protein